MTNEPTTGEMIDVLRENGDVYFGETEITCDQIADRLESQAKQIAELTAAIKTQSDLCRECAALTVIEQKAEIDALTARAESAEQERDVAIKELEVIEQDGLCSICKFESTIPLMECMENCVFKWRGKPQEGVKE